MLCLLSEYGPDGMLVETETEEMDVSLVENSVESLFHDVSEAVAIESDVETENKEDLIIELDVVERLIEVSRVVGEPINEIEPLELL